MPSIPLTSSWVEVASGGKVSRICDGDIGSGASAVCAIEGDARQLVTLEVVHVQLVALEVVLQVQLVPLEVVQVQLVP